VGELTQQARRGVEVGHHFTLIGIEALLQIVHLTLCAIGCAVASHQETYGDADDDADDREQPGREGLFHESFLYIKRLCCSGHENPGVVTSRPTTAETRCVPVLHHPTRWFFNRLIR